MNILSLYPLGKKGQGGSSHKPIVLNTEKYTANIFIVNLQNMLFFLLENVYPWESEFEI